MRLGCWRGSRLTLRYSMSVSGQLVSPPRLPETGTGVAQNRLSSVQSGPLSVGPTSADGRVRFDTGRICPSSCHIWPIPRKISAKICRCWSTFAQDLSVLGRIWPDLAKVGRTRPKFCGARPNLVERVRTRPNLDRDLVELGRIWETSASADFVPTSMKVGPTLTELDCFRPGQHSPRDLPDLCDVG